MAEQFYDVTHPVRRELHKAYIRKCLDNFKDNNGVIQLIGAEYTGPLHFVQFWLDVIAEWEKETGQKEIIGLSTTKDVQDSILADPVRAAAVDVIDIRYWQYQPDGSVYAPKGGQNLAPRQQARLFKPKRTTFEQVYRAVREYRQKYPDKAVLFSADGFDAFGWAAFMAGGSLPNLPATINMEFLKDAATMQPIDLPGNPAGQWALGKEGRGFVVYNNSPNPFQLNLEKETGVFKVRWLNPKNGTILSKEEKVKGGKNISLKSPQQEAVVLWITK
jgi:hypothetical protein